MEPSRIEKILEAKRKPEAGTEEKPEGEKFFSILVGDGLQENFLEVRYRDGARFCFSYTDLLWFGFDPDDQCIDLEFGGIQITIVGRGLCPKLFEGIKNKRVAWVKEADSEMEDNDDNETYISEILVALEGGKEKQQDGNQAE